MENAVGTKDVDDMPRNVDPTGQEQVGFTCTPRGDHEKEEIRTCDSLYIAVTQVP